MITLFEDFKMNYLQEFFENEGFNVHIFEVNLGVNHTSAEIEKLTDEGITVTITLVPFTKEEFIDYVENFNIDVEIDANRNDEYYRANFTMAQSRKDFKKFHKDLKKIVKKMESKNFIMNQKASKYNI